MSQMIERVSEALRAKFPEGSSGTMPASKDGSHDFGLYGDWARTAIEAMREPTDEMKEAALIYGEVTALDAHHCWCEMIDAALQRS